MRRYYCRPTEEDEFGETVCACEFEPDENGTWCKWEQVSATLEAKDLEISKQRAAIVALQLERGTWECRFSRAFAGWERSQDQVDRVLGKLEAKGREPERWRKTDRWRWT